MIESLMLLLRFKKDYMIFLLHDSDIIFINSLYPNIKLFLILKSNKLIHDQIKTV